MSTGESNIASEVPVADLIAKGGDVKIHGRTMGEIYTFFHSNVKFAALLLEGVVAERAFYDVGDVRYDVFAERSSTLLGDWTLLTRVGGNAAAQLRANWARGEGELITREAHRYVLKTTKGPKPHTDIKREVGDRLILTISSHGFPAVRDVVVHPSETLADEFHAILSLVVFYLVVIDHAFAASS